MKYNLLRKDKRRYSGGTVPLFQKYYRKSQESNLRPLKFFYKCVFSVLKRHRYIELSVDTRIGSGLYIGHPMGITINPKAILGKNINIHKGVTIGQENRGKRKGVPIIGNEVWIGINSTIVGNVSIGNDVLIAPNSYVNCDVPDHSIVIGNPCIIKHRDNATEDYINNRI